MFPISVLHPSSLVIVWYVIISNPGTGKTRVIVELVYQHLKEHPEARILVCADSNAVVDILATRISSLDIGIIRVGHVARLPAHLIPFSVESRQAQGLMGSEVFSDRPVVLATLTRCASPRGLGGSFDVLVVDEAGQAKVSITISFVFLYVHS